MTHPRTLVVVERGARAVVQETYLTRDSGGGAFTNAVTELVVGDGGRLDHARLQREDKSAYHVATTQSHQGRDSVLESCSVAFGAGLARHDLGAVLGGSGAFLTLNGLSVLDGKQHVDCHTIIDHAQPHCESHEVFNGVFDDHARGIFNGRIVVRPGAQRTDSKQTNNNLLLSADARADSQPQLEIYADDVKCTHGATLGPLDDASMFYLQSRGIDAAAARRMLTYGFGADIVERISNEPVRRQFDLALAERLGEMLGMASK
jgi:Fe-S cluster assembly protein SufD